jgi:hypothetical protein
MKMTMKNFDNKVIISRWMIGVTISVIVLDACALVWCLHFEKVLSWEGLMGYMFFLSTLFSMTISAILLILMRHIFGRRNKSNLFLFTFTFLISWLLYCLTNGLIGYYLVNCSPGRYLEGNENICKGNLTFVAMLLANSFMSMLTFFNAFLCYRSQYLMRPKNYYEAPIGPKDYDEIHDPSLKVKSINSRIDIIKEAIHASIIQGTQPLFNDAPTNVYNNKIFRMRSAGSIGAMRKGSKCSSYAASVALSKSSFSDRPSPRNSTDHPISRIEEE